MSLFFAQDLQNFKIIFYRLIVVIKTNMTTTTQIKTRENLEQIVGALLLLGGTYKLIKVGTQYCKLAYGYYKYSRMDQKNKHKMSGLIANPSKKEEVILQMSFRANKQIFRHHFNEMKEKNNKDPDIVHLINQPCETFEGSVTEDDKKYRLICKPFINNKILMTSSLLKKLKSLEKNNQKRNFNAIAYGSIQYFPNKKNFQFQISALVMSKFQIDQTWQVILKSTNYYQLFILGAVLGVGFSIAKNHNQSYLLYYKQLRQMFESYFEKKSVQ